MDDVRLNLLGRPQVWRNDELVTEFASDKVVALLAYLVLASGPVSRAELEGLLWGESPRDKAQTSLRAALYNLNKLLNGRFPTTRKTAEFDRERPFTLDLHALQNALQQGDPLAAADLYRGDFLHGLYFDDAPEFELWLLRRREAIRQQLLDALETALADPQTAPAAALRASRRLIELEPWREAAYRRQMRLLAADGRFTAALKLHADLRASLRQELGVDPAPESAALAERIQKLRQRPFRHNLPPPIPTLYGRAAELDALQNASRQGERLLSLTGLGGSGKTTLAVAAAHALLPHFLEGACFVSFAGIAPETAVSHLTHALAQAGILPPYQRGDAADHLCQGLQGQELLLLLDNAEGSLEPLRPLLTRLRQETAVTCLVTSQQKLDLAAEWGLPLRGLDEVAARQLFQAAARRAWPDFSLTPADETAVQAIYQQVGGNPLALELAAALAAHQGCAATAAALAENLDLMQSDQPDRAARQRSARAMFSALWPHLPPELRPLLPRLAIFPAAISPEAAQKVTQATPNQLRALVNHSLLHQLAAPDGALSYRVHPLVRRYALEQLGETAVYAQYAQYQSDRAAALHAQLGSDQAAAWPALQQTEPDLRQAWQWALAQERGDLLPPLWEALSFLYAESGEFARGWALFEAALAQLGGLAALENPPAAWSPILLARLAIVYARFLYYMQQHGASRAAIAAALPILRAAGSAAELALALRGLSLTEPDAAQSLVYERESLALFRQAGDGWQVARSLINLGVGLGHNGDYGAAIAHYDEAIALLRGLDDRLELARALEFRGEAAGLLGDGATAVALMQESVVLRRETGDRSGLASALFNLGRLSLELGRVDEAVALLAEMETAVDAADNPLGMALLRFGQSQAALAQGDGALAAQRIQQAAAQLAREETVSTSTLSAAYGGEVAAFVALGQGDVALGAGQAEKAVGYFREAVAGFTAVSQVGRALLAQARLAQALSAAGEVEEEAELATAVAQPPATPQPAH